MKSPQGTLMTAVDIVPIWTVYLDNVLKPCLGLQLLFNECAFISQCKAPFVGPCKQTSTKNTAELTSDALTRSMALAFQESS